MINGETCTCEELSGLMADNDIKDVDVREWPEYASGHIPGSIMIPLRQLKADPHVVKAGKTLLVCKSGRRAQEAAHLLHDCPGVEPILLEGGIDALRNYGFPLRKKEGPISLERQVRIAAGSLILLGLLVPPARGLAYFVGAGLVFAGVTDFCGLALLLARLPWNHPCKNSSVCSESLNG